MLPVNQQVVLKATLAVFAAVTISGCNTEKPPAPAAPPATGTPTQTSAAAEAASKPAAVDGARVSTSTDPLLADWKDPAAVILLSGEQHGYFEPCGCSLHQLGGMARRGELVRILSEVRKWPVTGLDVGGLIRRSRRQDQIKFLLMLDALKHMNYAGVALGVEDLRLGADFLLQQMPADPEQQASSPAMLGANVVLFDQPDLGVPAASRITKLGGVRVGVTAVVGASHREQIAPTGSNLNIAIKDPNDVLPGVIEKLTAEAPDLLILLSHGSEAEARALAEKFPQFSIILTAGGPEEADPKPVIVGKTWILQAGHKGKRVGVLGFFPKSEPRFRYELVELDDTRFKNDPHMRDLMKNYQQQIQDESLATSEDLLLRHPSGNSFVGAAKCGECHKKAYEHWKDTKHAEGLASLKTGHPGQEHEWIVRIHDPECLSCHITGWEPQQMLRFESGYITEEKSPHLVGQQCENCHGPGSRHVSLEEALVADATGTAMPDVLAARTNVRRTLEQARKEMCIQCHDSDNSPRFTPDAFMDYWDMVAHPWKD